MKELMVAAAVLASMAVVGCGGTGGGAGGGFDPLASPGAGMGATVVTTNGGIKPGDFVETSVNSASFFNVRPRGDADANKLLAAGTPLRVIESDNSYVKVELDSGEVGFVPTIMVVARGATGMDAYVEEDNGLSGPEVIAPLE